MVQEVIEVGLEQQLLDVWSIILQNEVSSGMWQRNPEYSLTVMSLMDHLLTSLDYVGAEVGLNLPGMRCRRLFHLYGPVKSERHITKQGLDLVTTQVCYATDFERLFMKIESALRASEKGVHTFVADGREAGTLRRLVAGATDETVGTRIG